MLFGSCLVGVLGWDDLPCVPRGNGGGVPALERGATGSGSTLTGVCVCVCPYETIQTFPNPETWVNHEVRAKRHLSWGSYTPASQLTEHLADVITNGYNTSLKTPACICDHLPP